MKRLFMVFVLSIICSELLFSQKIGRHVFSTAGGVDVAQDIHLSWTIGQSGLAGALIQNDLLLNQGFEQENDDLFVAVIDIEQQQISVVLFPNPATEAAYIKFTTEIHGRYSWSLFDYKGTLIALKKSKSFLQGSFIERIPTKALSPGMYFINLVITPDEKNAKQHILKLIIV